MTQYCKGDYVKYSTNGVCMITDIGRPDFDKTAAEDSYYFLRPVSDRSTVIFVPKWNELLLSKMRKLLTREEIDALILSVNNDSIAWIDDRKKRAERFGEILKQNDPLGLLRMIGCLYIKKQQLAELGANRKLSFSDLDTLERAERLIEDEFSFVLGIRPSEVADYIRKKIEE